MQAAHVRLVENGGHRADGGKRRPKLLQKRFLKHSGMLGGFVTVLFKDVPRSEGEIVQTSERNEVFDHRTAALGALAEPHRRHLRERADWLCQAAFYRFHAGNERRRHRPLANQKDAQCAGGRRNLEVVFIGQFISPYQPFLLTPGEWDLAWTAGANHMGRTLSCSKMNVSCRATATRQPAAPRLPNAPEVPGSGGSAVPRVCFPGASGRSAPRNRHRGRTTLQI